MLTQKFIFTKNNLKILKSIKYKPLTTIGNVVFQMKYSKNETFPECIIRAIEGNFSIRKTHYFNNLLYWDNDYWEKIALNSAISAINREWLPAGQQLKMSGTRYVEKHGSTALNNCAAITTKGDLLIAIKKMFFLLRHGCGVGFDLKWEGKLKKPLTNVKINDEFKTEELIIELIKSWLTGGAKMIPNDDNKVFNLIDTTCRNFFEGKINKTHFLVDIMNIIGVYMASTYERGAQIAFGNPEDSSFLDIKNYKKNPYRREFGWISNNSVIFKNRKEFNLFLPNIIERIIETSEPGIIYLPNVQKYGRYGDIMHDNASLVNLCAEIPLESYELCNLVSTFPTNCYNSNGWFNALRYATLHASNVSLLPTLDPEINAKIAKNRRIGVSISGIAYLFDNMERRKLRFLFRRGYKIVKNINKALNKMSGVPQSVRVTCVKPEGSISYLANTTPGIHYPIATYCKRRISIHKNSFLSKKLIEANIPYENDVRDNKRYSFIFPLINRNIRTIKDINLEIQLQNIAFMQREFCDNSISTTCIFKEEENDMIEKLLSKYMKTLKSISMMPYTQEIYEQTPFEETTKSEIMDIKNGIKYDVL
jgi:ribonucleoside-diphosphate reductase alpha chain